MQHLELCAGQQGTQEPLKTPEHPDLKLAILQTLVLAWAVRNTGQ